MTATSACSARRPGSMSQSGNWLPVRVRGTASSSARCLERSQPVPVSIARALGRPRGERHPSVRDIRVHELLDGPAQDFAQGSSPARGDGQAAVSDIDVSVPRVAGPLLALVAPQTDGRS
jgi:hypothetical protein